MTKITRSHRHGSLTVTNSLTEAHTFASYMAAAQWAKTEPLPVTYRIEDRTNPVTGEEAATIHFPGIIDQWVAMPDTTIKQDIMADYRDRIIELEEQVAGLLEELGDTEPDNSDEEPDQLR